MRTRSLSLTSLAFGAAALCGIQVSAQAAESWDEVPGLNVTLLMGVDFIDASVGYVAGGTSDSAAIWGSFDGGNTWVRQTKNSQTAGYFDVSVGSEGHALAGGMGINRILAGSSFTTDGVTWRPSQDRWTFATWQDVDAINGQDMVMIGWWFAPRDTGYGIAMSHDGGMSYEYFPWPYETATRYGSFLTPERGYVTGGEWPDDDSSRIMGNGDHAINQWMAVAGENPERADANYPGYQGVIAKTEDGGETWELLFQDFDRFYFNGIHFLDEMNGWAVAEGDEGAWIFHTADGGETWEEQHFEPSGSLMQIHMINDRVGWAGGAMIEGAGFSTLLLKTTDGGRTWTKYNMRDRYYIFNLDFYDENRGWAVAYGAADGLCSVLSYTAN